VNRPRKNFYCETLEIFCFNWNSWDGELTLLLKVSINLFFFFLWALKEEHWNLKGFVDEKLSLKLIDIVTLTCKIQKTLISIPLNSFHCEANNQKNHYFVSRHIYAALPDFQVLSATKTFLFALFSFCCVLWLRSFQVQCVFSFADAWRILFKDLNICTCLVSQHEYDV
jgi:hypothetical protein